MTQFLKGNLLNSKLDEILEKAESKLYIISPFIKLHARTKDSLRRKINNDKLQIVIVFGKNESKRVRSLNKDDFDFLTSFPNVTIKYESLLHAKYYANERASVLSSMNLYDYSQNNNIEFGIYFKANGMFQNFLRNQNLDTEARTYFNGVQKNAEIIFKKTPRYQEQFFGLIKKYTKSVVEIDNSSSIFETKEMKVPAQLTPISKQKANLLAATALGRLKNPIVPYAQVVKVMTAKGLISGKTILEKGFQEGLEYASKGEGESWIVYPESLKELL